MAPRLSCDEAELRLAAFVVGSLPPAETGALRRHLLGCAACRARGAELQGAADRLALSVELVEPAPSLRARLLAHVYAEAAGSRLAVSPPGALWRRLWERIPAGRALTAGGALVTAAAVAVAAVAVTHRGGAGTPSPLRAAACGLSGMPQACGTLTYDSATRTGVLDVTGLAPPPTVDGRPTRSYEVWLVRQDHSVVPAAFLTAAPSGSTLSAPMSGDMGGVVAVAATAEPPLGSPTPTGPELFRITLPGATGG